MKPNSSFDQMDQDINVVDINHLQDQEQAEIIADKFSSIQNEYDHLKTKDDSIPQFIEEEIPNFFPSQVWLILAQLKTNKATVPGDFPARLIKIIWSLSCRTICRYCQHRCKEGWVPPNIQILNINPSSQKISAENHLRNKKNQLLIKMG